MGDLTTGKRFHRVEVQGFQAGPVKRHGCPSHGIGLTPDETEIWVVDALNKRLHVFDATVMPPKQVASLPVRDEPGWVTFTIDGQYAYPSTGEVIDVATRKTVATLADETGARSRARRWSRSTSRTADPSGPATSSASGRVTGPGPAGAFDKADLIRDSWNA